MESAATKPAAAVSAPSAAAAASVAAPFSAATAATGGTAAGAVPPKVSPRPQLQKQSKVVTFVTVPVVDIMLLLQL